MSWGGLQTSVGNYKDTSINAAGHISSFSIISQTSHLPSKWMSLFGLGHHECRSPWRDMICWGHWSSGKSIGERVRVQWQGEVHSGLACKRLQVLMFLTGWGCRERVRVQWQGEAHGASGVASCGPWPSTCAWNMCWMMLSQRSWGR